MSQSEIHDLEPSQVLSKGEYQLKLPPPFVPGMETAGVVRSAPSASGLRVGERVSAFGVLGGYAERVAVAVANVVRSPAELDDAEAVSLLVNYNTMYFALARRAAMRPGLTACANIPTGQGVDIAVDPIGGPPFDDAIRVLAIDGELLVIGFAAGSIPTVKVNRLLLRNVSVVGVAWGEYLNKVPGSAALFSWGLGQLVSLGLKPPPPQRYPLSEAQAALQCLGRRRCAGQARPRAVEIYRVTSQRPRYRAGVGRLGLRMGVPGSGQRRSELLMKRCRLLEQPPDTPGRIHRTVQRWALILRLGPLPPSRLSGPRRPHWPRRAPSAELIFATSAAAAAINCGA